MSGAEAGWADLACDGTLRFDGRTMRAAVGHGGITRTMMVGDGATPAGRLPLLRVLYRADRGARPRTVLPTEPISEQDGWCDDPQDRAYNTQIRLPNPAHHEELWRRDALYDIVGVLGWIIPAVRGRGSAVFLHVAAPDYAPTDGCVALAMPDLLLVLGSGLKGITVRG